MHLENETSLLSANERTPPARATRNSSITRCMWTVLWRLAPASLSLGRLAAMCQSSRLSCESADCTTASLPLRRRGLVFLLLLPPRRDGGKSCARGKAAQGPGSPSWSLDSEFSESDVEEDSASACSDPARGGGGPARAAVHRWLLSLAPPLRRSPGAC